LKNLAEKFPNQGVEKTSMGDASIVVLGKFILLSDRIHNYFFLSSNHHILQILTLFGIIKACQVSSDCAFLLR
jgi:hypothetical protein